MPDLDLNAIAERYHRALDAKPGKGPISEAGIAAITDSVSDIPDLLREIERLMRRVGDERDMYLDAHGAGLKLAQRAIKAEEAIARVRPLISDWQANAGSRALGDPTANAWDEAARQLLAALDPAQRPEPGGPRRPHEEEV